VLTFLLVTMDVETTVLIGTAHKHTLYIDTEKQRTQSQQCSHIKLVLYLFAPLIPENKMLLIVDLDPLLAHVIHDQ
jgi:hypothetical protein